MDAAEKLKNPEFTAMLLEYRHKNFSQEEMEKAENKAIERVLSGAGPAVKELQKSWLFQSVKDGREITAYKGTERVVFVPEKIWKRRSDGNRRICLFSQSTIRRGQKCEGAGGN